MRIIPAVDMLDGHVVQLVGGELGSEQLKLPDPFETAMSWVLVCAGAGIGRQAWLRARCRKA